MVFSSFTFILLFLPVVLLLYYAIPKNKNNIRNLILLLFSLLFYAWGEPIYIILMVLSILLNYIFAILVDKYDKKSKIFLILSIIFNIGILGFFKYGDFLLVNINGLLGTKLSLLNIPLPIGISFFTFQIMSYVIDVYRKKVRVQKNIINLATYVALFPQLIAGPIVRYITIEDELENRKESINLFAEGLRRFIIGLAKKVIIANNVSILADAVFNNVPSDFGTIVIWLATLAYALQIYFDFSGYSDMAIGLGKMFGFNFLENFDYPYISKSITDFWRRWHISLSTWFRDYIYIPLGGNRVGLIRWLINIFIVWFATGLWHGSSWNYVIWGLYFAIILVIEKKFIGKWLEKTPKIFQHSYAIFFILLGWVIFRVENFQYLLEFLSRMFIYNKTNIVEFFIEHDATMQVWPYLILGFIGSTPLIKNLYAILENSKKEWIKYLYDFYLLGILLLTILYLVSSTFNPFIYFRF